ncbi:hypothetical protein BDQ17DRAFT_1329777 [Cyathus striatus]|nr:hypothetical protein BDQ17DRAFT_1329777 [Cyathus striatus]
MKELGILTARHNGFTGDQKKQAINLVTQDDPAGRWGDVIRILRLLKLAIHIPEKFTILGFGLLVQMKNAIWGIIDKFSRMELSLIAMPNARIQQIPPIIFLRLVKEKGGMPLIVTGDKGTELGLLISLVMAMRQWFQPFLPEAQLPAFRAVKSTYNITRERGWRPLWEKELSNVVYEYKAGKVTSGYVDSDDIHSFRMISYWLWGKIVQDHLNEVRIENQSHRIHSQKKILLPSGARRIDIYSMPERHGGKDHLIKTEDKVINKLLNEYDRPDLLLFGSPENVAVCKDIYIGIVWKARQPRSTTSK